jgi:3-hydroxy-9,10-secoandrosta-1,3,5(10)-triene-9,17-dione monooxygenase reductase component
MMDGAVRELAPEPSDFRKAMGSFAAGVTVVTVCHDGRLVGTTVSAFSSVSMDPPLVMVCLKRDSRTLAALGQAKSVLRQHPGQRPGRPGLSLRQERGRRPLRPDRRRGRGLRRAAAGRRRSAVECELHAAHDGGDHEILVGRVLRVVVDEAKAPLVYVRGGFLNA